MPVWLNRLRLRLRAMWSRGHDRALRDELQLHLDLLTDAFVAEGLSPEEARRRAHREFGNATSLQEASHELFAWRFLEGLAKDVRYALLELRRSPGFTGVAVVSLAVGIGIATSAFSVIDALLLRGLPVPQPERLVALSTATSASWSRWSTGMFRQWAGAKEAVFDATAVYDLTERERPRIPRMPGARVSLVAGNYFEVMGIGAVAGRLLERDDDRFPSPATAAVISYSFMERHFPSMGASVGRTLDINGRLFEVVGVARPGFTGEWVGQPTDIWLPLSAQPWILQGGNRLEATSTTPWLRVIARLRPGFTSGVAAVSANLLYHRWVSRQSAATARDRSAQIALPSAARGYAPLRQRYAQPLMIAGLIIVLVLIVACANFTNVLYGRSRSRQQEFAVRLVLGAGAWRIMRQSLTECVLLAGAAGALGLLVSSWATTAALRRFADTIQPLELDAGLDARTLAFAAGCVGLVVLFGLMPCIAGSRRTAAQHVAQAAMRERRGNLVGRSFLVAQLALCAVLLIAAGLMIRTVVNLRSQSLGFQRNVLLLTVAPAHAGYAGEAAALLLERIRERLQAIQGIVSVSTTSVPLLDNRAYWVDSTERLSIDDGEPARGGRWTFADVGPGFFETMGMPLMLGRGLTEADVVTRADVVVINQSLARVLFGSQNPIGRAIGVAPTAPKLTVVGVVNDARQTSPRDQGLAVMYRPLRETPSEVVLVVRTDGPAAAAVDVVRHQLTSLDERLPVDSVRTVEDILDRAIAQERLLATLAAWLAVVVIVVACVGLHALVANDVAERTHEIGVRLALGATRGGVTMLVLRECAQLVGLALCIGVPLSLGATRPLSSQLYDLRPDDPQTILAVVMLLATIAFVAAIRPARTAGRVDPLMLLRAD